MGVSDSSIGKAKQGLAILLAVLDELEHGAAEEDLVLARFLDKENRTGKRMSEKDYLRGLLRDARKVAKRSFNELGGTSAELAAVRKARTKEALSQIFTAYLKAARSEGEA